MPPSQMQVACPNCRAPITATVEQLFDVTQDPGAKNRFIGGRFNQLQCPTCHYQGQLAMPLLYHDAEKELLLSYVPMELGLPQPEQEKILGRLMNEVINRLPPEKRKGYLLNPKPAFTLEGMRERVLEGEGITKEMLEAQRAKAQLVQKFMTTPEDQLADLVKAHDAEMDATFFQLIGASAQATAAGGNQAAAQQLIALQTKLLDLSSFGAQAKKQQQLYDEVARELEKLGEKLTRDKLLELILKAEDEDKVAAYVSMTRPAVDYAFFEALTKRIDKASGAEKERLSHRRDHILQLTKEIDEAAQAQMARATELLRALLEAPDLNQALVDRLPQIDDTFMAVLNANLQAAQKAGRSDVVQRLNQISEAILRLVQEAAPPEIQFINELLEIESDAEAEAALKSRASEITEQTVEVMNYVIENLRQNKQAALADRLEKLHGIALGELMAANWKK